MVLSRLLSNFANSNDEPQRLPPGFTQNAPQVDDDGMLEWKAATGAALLPRL